MRSLLFVPGHDLRKLEKSLSAGADVLVLDLEDAVPASSKTAAREITARFVAQHRHTHRLVVRVNAWSTGLCQPDLDAVVQAQPEGIMLPKCQSAQDVQDIGAILSALELKHGLSEGALGIWPIVTETAASLFHLGTYQQAGPRLRALLWGGEDLCADLGARSNRSEDGNYTAPYNLARSLSLLAATAAQVMAIDAVYTRFRDVDGLREEARLAVRDGFGAKAAIHPDQIGPIHEAFTPSPDQLAWAQRVIEAFDASPDSGAIALNEQMLDRPHERLARRWLEQVDASKPRNSP